MEGEIVQTSSTIGGFLAGIAIAAFGYFLYTKYRASKDKPPSTGGGGGSGGSAGKTHHK